MSRRKAARVGAVLGFMAVVLGMAIPANAVNDVTGAITPNGAAVTTTTTQADQNVVLSFSLAAMRKVSVRFTASDFSSGSLRVVDASAVTRSSRGLALGAGFLEPISLPAGSYTVVIDPSGTQTGSITSELFAVTDVIGTIVADGSATAAATTRPGQDVRLRFSGTAGQRVGLRASGISVTGSSLSITSCCAVRASILRPSGAALRGPSSAGTSNPVFLDTVTLPSTGTYTVLLDPDRDTVLGAITANLFTVPADVTSPIATDGTPVTTATTTPGQDIRLTFTGTAGGRVSFRISDVAVSGPSLALAACCALNASIVDPGGSTLSGPSFVGTSAARFVDPVTLPVGGTYTLLLSPDEDAVLSSVTASLWNVPANVTGAIATNGTPVTDATTTPGQNVRLTFNGTAGDRLGMRISNVGVAGPTLAVASCCALKASILRPDGTTLVSAASVGTSAPRFFEPVTLPATGAYTIVLDPDRDAVLSSVTTSAWVVPADVSSPITANGTPLSSSTSTPGQNARLTFAGTAGQRVSLRLDGIAVNGSSLATTTCCALGVSILRPNGTTVVGPSNAGTSAPRFLDTVALPVNGTYTILLDPDKDTVVSSMTTTLWTVPNDVAGAATVGGGGVGISTTTPGQGARITFTGTAGQAVTIAFTRVSAAGGSLASSSGLFRASVLKPDMTTLVTPASVGTAGRSIPATLPANGTYTLVIDPQLDAVVSATVTIT